MKLRNRESLPVLGGFLGGISLLAAVVLALVSQLTAEPIARAAEKERQQVFHRLGLPDFDRAGDGEISGNIQFVPVFREDRKVGFVGQTSRAGYGGSIEVLAGLDLDGTVTGVQVLRHKETPGLGANVCDRKFQRTVLNLSEKAPEIPANRMLDQFSGKKAVPGKIWKVTKDGGDVEYLTGATVTSRAVTAAVNDIAAEFMLRQKNSGKESAE